MASTFKSLPSAASSGSSSNVDVISSVLPTGAATETTLAAVNTKTPALVSGRVPVDGSGVTQPISGSVSVSGSVAVTGALTDAELRATAVPVSGPLTDAELRATAVPVSGPLTDAELRATAVPVSGPLTDAELRATAVPVSGPLTDAELRATAVPVSGPLTDAELRATAVPVSGPLTDAELRATAVPVSGTVTANAGSGTFAVSGPLTDAELRATSVPVSGPLTDAQLRASAVPVSASALPLPSGASTSAEQVLQTTELTAIKTSVATAANQTTANASLSSIDTKTPALVGGRQPVLAAGTNADGASAAVQLTENGALSVGNAYKKFRDGFAALAQDAGPSASIWTEAWTNQGSSFRGRRGNAAGAAYMQISLCPIIAGSQYVMESVQTYKLPQRFMVGFSASQRIIGQELEVSLVAADGSGVETLTAIADQSISGTISVTSNVATINFASAHPFRGGDRVILKNNTDSRMNVGPVVVTVITATQITVPLTIANATYTAGGSVQWADQFAYARNAGGMLYENASATQSSFVTRRNGYNTRSVNATVATTVATQSSTSAYSDPFNATSRSEFFLNQEELVLLTRTQDSVSAQSGLNRWSQGLPDEEKEYRVRVRAKSLENMTVPVARITAIAKTGTTTATVTTDVAHGLTTSDFVQIYGVRDQAASAFPNLTAATVVASIISSTEFTIVIGTAATVSSAGGAVWRVNGGVLAPGVFSQVAQSISRTSNVLTIVGNATWATPFPGENVHLYGCDATSMGLYDGAYKVLRVSTTSLELESIGSDFGSINCGGAVIRRTDARVHFVSQIEHTRHIMQLDNSNGANDATRSLPVNAVINSGTVTTVSTVSTVTTVTAGGLQIPITVADVASAAIASSATVAAITPAQGTSYTVSIPVTAASGTNPTLDIAIEESDDSGTNWFKVYDFPRITAVGMYRSPNLRLQGNRVRYAQTITGTSPSFTRAINRLQAHNPGAIIRQIIDRTIVPNTINSTSPSLLVEGCDNFNVMVRCTAQSGAATIAIQFSHDGTNWHTSGTTVSTVVGIAHAKVQNEQWKFARLIVSAAGSGITLAEAVLVGRGE